MRERASERRHDLPQQGRDRVQIQPWMYSASTCYPLLETEFKSVDSLITMESKTE
jgi:hypothetical protein